MSPGADLLGRSGEACRLLAAGRRAAEALVQLAARLRQDQRLDQLRIALRHAEGDVAAARMSQQVDRPGTQRLDEAGDILDMAVDGEVAALLPGAGPGVPHAERHDVVLGAEGRHLRAEAALVAQRAVDHQQRRAAPGLGIGYGVTIDFEARHRRLSPQLLPRA
jgi:hypothetical protein